MPYTPGYAEDVIAFMERRRLETHGAFVLPHLEGCERVLDLGCGPGSMTRDLARRLPEAHVCGVDQEASQIALAHSRAKEEGIENAAFLIAKATELPVEDRSLDLVFSHALFEHLPEPVRVLSEVRRVLRPGGKVALRSPDWGGWVWYPETAEIAEAFAAYETLQRGNGGDTHAGRKLGSWLRAAGFESVRVSGSYEVYRDTKLPAGYLARQLKREGLGQQAQALLDWAAHPDSLFAQSWMEAVGVLPQ